MKHKKTTLITIETSEVLVFRRASRSSRAWCEACGAEVEMVSVDVAVALADVSARTICAWVQEGSLHFAETPDRVLLVCLASLPARAGPTRPGVP
ncbi:MAG: hypothetical protein H7Z38_18710 [Rubrivivax sp.]|nr:hypothetical protein [Pyrinomonadaceae bacterium]